MKLLRAESVPGDVAQLHSLGHGQPASVAAEMFDARLYNSISMPCFFSKSHQDNLSAEMPRVKALPLRVYPIMCIPLTRPIRFVPQMSQYSTKCHWRCSGRPDSTAL